MFTSIVVRARAPRSALSRRRTAAKHGYAAPSVAEDAASIDRYVANVSIGCHGVSGPRHAFCKPRRPFPPHRQTPASVPVTLA
jgi:hypothetical protein